MNGVLIEQKLVEIVPKNLKKKKKEEKEKEKNQRSE